MTRRGHARDLAIAREVAELVIVEAALRVLADVLLHEHPCIHDLGEADPPTLHAARRLLAATRGLRAELRRYRDAVVHAEPDNDGLPF